MTVKEEHVEATTVLEEVSRNTGELVRQLGLASLGLLVVAGEGGTQLVRSALDKMRNAREESRGLFQKLVEKGEEFEPRGRDQLKEVGKQLRETASEVGSAAGKPLRVASDRVRGWAGKSEEALDLRVAEVLAKTGFPKREEIEQLVARLDELTAKLEKIQKDTGSGRRASGA